MNMKKKLSMRMLVYLVGLVPITVLGIITLIYTAMKMDDSIHAEVQGFNIGVKVTERVPYSRIEYADDGAPFHFTLKICFDPASDPYKTDFQIILDADLNFMMKTILGSKLKEGLDKVVDGLVDMSEGRMPEGLK